MHTPVIPAAVPEGGSGGPPARDETVKPVDPAPIVEAPPGVPEESEPARATGHAPGSPDTLLPAPAELIDDSVRAVESAAREVLEAAGSTAADVVGALPKHGSPLSDPVSAGPEVPAAVADHAAALPGPADSVQPEPPAAAPALVDAGGLGAPSLL